MFKYLINIEMNMKKVLILFIILINFPVNAQFIITSDYNPQVGDIHTLKNADEGEIEPGPSGANQFWNFSNIKPGYDSISTYYVLKCTTPYGNRFDSANIASYTGEYSFNYYNTNTNNFQFLGTGDTNRVIVLSDPAILMQYPFAYGNTFTDNFGASTNIGLFIVKKSGIRSVIADSYGTISLPSGLSNNVMRMKITEAIIDSIFLNGTLVSVEQSFDTSYVWYKSNYKFPIMRISYIYNQSGSYKYVGFVTNSATIGIQHISTEIPSESKLYQNYPNPFNPTTNIFFDIPKDGIVKLKVFDITGREIRTLVNEFRNAGQYLVAFNASELSSGIYFYILKSGDFASVKKMVILK